ncbi:MAG: hypothetical protein ACRC2R_13300 [Xenococcaceae cyanobacterium]
MNKNILSVLGCSGSLALALVNVNSAIAQPTDVNVKELVFKAPTIDRVEVNSDTQKQPTPFNLDEEMSDREGQKAIDLYGCDCNGCRNLVSSLR